MSIMLSLIPLLAVASFLSGSFVKAHMQMSNPYPIDSPLNSATPENLKDYSYTAPLSPDGSNYPCKGYHTQTPILYTASYAAGQSSSITLAGSASHGGGSCQISLSYDNGATFKVIKSIMGGCPLTSTYSFTVPSFAPAGNALLAWTWFNKIGNREMYMNCAWVHIANGGSKARRSRRRDTASFNALPDIFLADIGQKGSNVQTIEGDEPTFPYPGSNIEYGGSITSASPLGQGFSGTPPSQNIGSSPSDSGSKPSPSVTDAPTSTSDFSSGSGTPIPPSNSPGVFAPFPMSNTSSTTATSPPSLTPTPTIPPNPPIPSASSCSPGMLLCPSPDTFALCNADGTPTSPQAVALGTQCSNGNIILADNSGPCNAPPGSWLCRDGGMSFSACSNGYWINMGSVAAGTTCRDGTIVAS